MREKLTNRRLVWTVRLRFMPPGDAAAEHGIAAQAIEFDVHFGFEPGGRVKEVFALPFRVGSDRQNEMHRFCMAFSIALQCGRTCAQMAKTMCAADMAAPAADMFDLIVRNAMMIDAERTREYRELEFLTIYGRDLPPDPPLDDATPPAGSAIIREMAA